MGLPKKAEIVEVGPRDGLQNESSFIATEKKIELINKLSKTGIKRMEAVSFVHPGYVPQMRDAEEVLSHIDYNPSVQYMALIPNDKGYERAVKHHVQALSLVVGASERFNQANVKMTRKASMDKFTYVVKKAKEHNAFIRYSIATSFWCPFEGKVNPEIVLEMVQKIDGMGVDEIVICDTTGRANPDQVYSLLERTIAQKTKAKISAHFHDTYGMGLANVTAAIHAGVTSFDASAGGLGGCPFSPGAAGNIATEDVVFMLEEMGIQTGIDIKRLLACTELIKPLTNRELTGHIHKVRNVCR